MALACYILETFPGLSREKFLSEEWNWKKRVVYGCVQCEGVWVLWRKALIRMFIKTIMLVVLCILYMSPLDCG